jgi:hypothetical protein
MWSWATRIATTSCASKVAGSSRIKVFSYSTKSKRQTLAEVYRDIIVHLDECLINNHIGAAMFFTRPGCQVLESQADQSGPELGPTVPARAEIAR